jgi:hypothetical protein
VPESDRVVETDHAELIVAPLEGDLVVGTAERSSAARSIPVEVPDDP